MDWDKAQAFVNQAQRILIVTHISPDGDAIGSLLGLGHALKEHGKTVTLAVDGGVPASLRFLPGVDEVRPNLENNFQSDLLISVDCSDVSRTGNVGKQGRIPGVPTINLDHHRTNVMFADVNLVEIETVAACEGVLHWLDRLGIPLSVNSAQCLLCGLVTDTLCFRTSNVTADTLSVAQRLLAAGADLSAIVQRTVNHISAPALQLWKHVMPTVCQEDHVIWALISLDARKASGYMEGSDGGLVGFLVQTEGAYISCVLREKDDKSVDISLRAVPGFDVSAFALSLGGGGHSLAAGAVVSGTLSEVESRVIPALKEIAKASTPKYT